MRLGENSGGSSTPSTSAGAFCCIGVPVALEGISAVGVDISFMVKLRCSGVTDQQ
jgi:hypothetical protein